MTTGAGRDAERFAAAVDSGHRYAGAQSPEDHELARDLELVALLRSSRESLAPSADASARMRAKVMAAAAATMAQPVADTETTKPDLMAGAAEVTAEEESSNVVSIGTAKGRHRFPRRSSSSDAPSRRGGVVSAAAALALLAAAGSGALFSKDALPGDTLYGVKQATESGTIALAGKGEAQRRLDIAATRIDEVQKLNSSDRTSATDRGSDISQALHGFNEQTTAASRTWLAGPNASNTGDLATWAGTQSQRLSGMRASMPESARSDADQSIKMLDQLKSRANALSNRKGCDTVTTGQTDELGPIPAKGACSTKEPASPQRQFVPGVPDTAQRSSGPSSSSQSKSGSSSSSPARDDSSDSGPGLQLPELPGTDTGGLLPNRVPTSDNTSTPEPGLLGGLLGGG
jgi:hypothetical protein